MGNREVASDSLAKAYKISGTEQPLKKTSHFSGKNAHRSDSSRSSPPVVIAGRNPVLEALRAGTVIEKIVILAGTHGRVLEEIKGLALEKRIPTVEATGDSFPRLLSGTNTQGILAFSREQRRTDLQALVRLAQQHGENGMILLLDHIEDPQNLGALIRTAECAGWHGIVLPRHQSASVSIGAIKASAGATAHMTIAEVANLVQAIEELKRKSYWIVGLDMSGKQSYTEVDYTVPVAVVVGSEGKGLRRLVREHCDFLVKIPLYGRIASLNASVAGALVMYEVRRQRSSHHS